MQIVWSGTLTLRTQQTVNTMGNHDIVVIGASAGGIETLKRLLPQLPTDFAAAVFIVQHTSPRSPGIVADILDHTALLPVTMAQNAMPFFNGHVYIAPPDRHMLIKEGHLHITMGPRENRARPAIDPLFRSAAATYGPRVIGIVLTGLLDDGAAGLLAIRRCNGVTVVQSPNDAVHSQMPESALACLNVDHCLPIVDMGDLLIKLTRKPVKAKVPIPDDIRIEVQIAENVMSDIPSEHKLGKLVSLACPECSGPLWEIETDAVGRYRCHVGHGFTRRALIAEQSEMIERTLWAALRSFEEKAKIQTTLAREERSRERPLSARLYEQQAEQSHQHAAQLRSLLLDNYDTPARIGENPDEAPNSDPASKD